MAEGENVTRTPNPDQLGRFRDLMESVQEQRAGANAEAGEAREILKGLGFGSVAIAMYKRLTDMSDGAGEAVFDELCQLLDADPKFDYSTGRPNLFADAAVKEAKKGNGSGKAKPKATKSDSEAALEKARQHLGTAESDQSVGVN